MIIGLGCDIVQVSRFDKGDSFINKFIKKHFTLKEIEEVIDKKERLVPKNLVLEVATRFAAKEAVSKALGSGFSQGVTLKDIEIIHDELGCPQVTLYRNALSRAYVVSKNQKFNMHLTLSNEREYVNAVAVIEC